MIGRRGSDLSPRRPRRAVKHLPGVPAEMVLRGAGQAALRRAQGVAGVADEPVLDHLTSGHVGGDGDAAVLGDAERAAVEGAVVEAA